MFNLQSLKKGSQIVYKMAKIVKIKKWSTLDLGDSADFAPSELP